MVKKIYFETVKKCPGSVYFPLLWLPLLIEVLGNMCIAVVC